MISKETLISYLKEKKQASFINIVKTFDIKSKDNKDFSKFLNSLKNNFEIAYSKKHDVYYVPKFLGSFECQYKINAKGFGFCFINYEDREIRVNLYEEDIFNLLKNDCIIVNTYQELDEDFYFGKVVKLIKRNTNYIYAQITTDLKIEPIFFSQEFYFKYDKKKLKPNTYVKFKIVKIFKNEISLELDKVIDNIHKPYSDINLILDYNHIEQQFSQEVIHEANLLPDKIETFDPNQRIDLTNQLIVTIDGEKTKDFDDAINVSKIRNNQYKIGIHIADVAYYVKENSAIDLEARKRGVSIYLIDKVIPMLPEKLSNGICSLNPNEKRFTLTLEAIIDLNGQILSSKIFPSVIESKYKLTYHQVEDMNNDVIIKSDNELQKMLHNAYELSSILSSKKANEGYLDFEVDESIIELDPRTGKTLSIKNKKRLSSEILIENFMILANEIVSRTIAKLNICSIYRIHKAPEEEKILSLKSFIKNIGISNVNVVNSHDPKIFQAMIEQIKKQRFDSLIKMALLRTMEKAKYSTKNIGHFGLASKYYSHFTSPIRRYSDLLLHRIIWEVLFKKNLKYSNDHCQIINDIAQKCSELEIRATDLERNVFDLKRAEYYENKINLVLIATIVSIQKFGLFVEFQDMSNSLVHISTLTSNNDYKISEDSYQLITKNRIYKIGQQVKVKIIKVDKMNGKIDSIIIE